MAPFEWTVEMSVGVDLLDADHRMFIAMINELEEIARLPARRTDTKRVLDGFVDYARYHFDREEEVMAACAYPAIKAHKKQHAAFDRVIHDVVGRFEDDLDARIGEWVVVYLREWLVHHILVEDMAYRPFVEGNAAAIEAARAFRPLYADGL